MNDLSNYNITLIIILSFILIFSFIIIHLYKFKKIIEIDNNIKETDKEGNIIKQGRSRNIWDYKFFPGLSKLILGAEWHKTVILFLLVILFFLYLKTHDELFKTLLITDFGIIIGAIIEKSSKN